PTRPGSLSQHTRPTAMMRESGASCQNWLLQAYPCEVASAHAVRALIIARKKLVGQRVNLENQIRGLALVFGVRLPRGLNPAFATQVKTASGGLPAVSGALLGLAGRDALVGAIAAINRDIKRLSRSFEACQRLMTIPGRAGVARSAETVWV